MPERGRLVVDVRGRTIGVFRLEGALYAYENTCPHQGGPVCQGKIVPRVAELIDEDRTSRGFELDEADMHIVCPWHGFEYEIKSGQHAGIADLLLTRIPVEESDGRVYVTL